MGGKLARTFIFTLLLSLSGALSLFFAYKGGLQLRDYVVLDSQKPALSTEWSLVQKHDSAFTLLASYEFSLSGKILQGKTEFQSPNFPNEESAKSAITTLSAQTWNVFFSKKDPSQNSLQRAFPLLACVHILITTGVFLYFFLLRHWTRRTLV